MQLTSHAVPHYSVPSGLPIYQIVNNNNVELACTTRQAALLAICTLDSQGTSRPMLHNHQEKITSYMSATAISGEVMGPIGFPYIDTSIQIGKRTRTLPGAREKKQFRSLHWRSTIHCTEHRCKILYQSAPPEREEVDNTILETSSHTIEMELNRKNRLFVRYTSRSDSGELFSLGHHLVWNLGRKGQSIFKQQMAINANQFASTPRSTELESVGGTEKDYRKQRGIGAQCEGYYRVHSGNITDAGQDFGRTMERLSPAVMLFDPQTNRYLQIYTNYPCVYISPYHNAREKGVGISIVPCILLDEPELIARKSARHTFRCCYQFGSIAYR